MCISFLNEMTYVPQEVWPSAKLKGKTDENENKLLEFARFHTEGEGNWDFPPSLPPPPQISLHWNYYIWKVGGNVLCRCFTKKAKVSTCKPKILYGNHDLYGLFCWGFMRPPRKAGDGHKTQVYIHTYMATDQR